MIEFSTHKQAGKDQLFIAVLYLVFLKPVLFKKKNDQQTPSSKILKTIPGNNETFLYQIIMTVQKETYSEWGQSLSSVCTSSIKQIFLEPERALSH